MTHLIFDIEQFCRDFHFSKVRIFVPDDYALYSLAGAAALATYLTKECHINATIVAKQEEVNKVSMCLPVTEEAESIEVNANDFLAVIIDCAKPEKCGNDAWNRTFCAFQVRGKVSMKDFGTESYNDPNALCAAEIIFNAIKKHSEENDTWCPECWNYLYLALLDATSMFKLHMKTNTFEAIQELINLGANPEIKPECFLKKQSDEILVLEKLYMDHRIEDEVGIIMFEDSKWKEMPISTFQNVLEYIRFVKLVCIWMAFIKYGDEYKVFVQGNASGKFDCTKMLKDYDGVGSRKKAKCKIKVDEFDDVIELTKNTIREAKSKEKPRKKYTRQQKSSDESEL